MNCTFVILSHDVVERSLFFDNLRYHKIPFFSYYFGYLFIKKIILIARIISLNSIQLLYLSVCWLFVYLFPVENIKKKVFLLVASQNMVAF